MQANLKAKEGESGYTTAFQGGVLVEDASGNVVGNIPYGTDDARAALSGSPIYKTASGEFTTKIPDIYADFDKNTGDLVIHAPKSVLEMQSFKDNVLNNSALSQLSAAYKTDPNYKFPDPDDDTKTISLQEQIEKLNEGLRQYKDAAQKLVDEREKLARTKGEKYRSLSLDQMSKALSYAQNDNDRQAIPNYLVELFKSYETFDSATQTVSKDELMRKWWSYDVVESDSKELLEKWMRLEAEIDYSDTRNPEDENVDYSMQESRFPDPEDAARMLSFEKFLKANDASTNTATGVSNNVRDIVKTELYSAAGQLSSGLLSAAAFVMSGFGAFKNPLTEGMATGAAELEKSVETMNDEIEVYNKGAAVMGDVMQTLGNLGAILTADVFVEDAAGLVAKGVDKIDDLASALGVISGNEKNIAKGAEFMLKVLPTATVGKVINTGVDLMRSSAGIAKFLGEVLVEAAVDNPQVMADFISNSNNSEDVKRALMEEAAYNGFGLAAGLGVSKTLSNFANTKIGKKMNTSLAVINAKVGVKASDVMYSVRTAIAKAPLEDALAEKAARAGAKGQVVKQADYLKMQQVARAQNEMREARRVLANTSVKDTEAIVKQIGNIKTLEATYDLYANGSRRMFSAIVTADPILRATNEATEKSLEKALKAQKEAGYAAAKSAKYGSSGLSEAASQYVSMTHRLHLAETAYKSTDSSLKNAAKDALPVYQKQMEKIMEDITPEMKIALDEYIINDRIFYRDINDWAIAKGLISQETIDAYRANPLFADNHYMRIVVEQDADKIRMMRADGLIKEDSLLDIKHIKLPAEAQKFVDPEIVRNWYGLEIAKSYNAQNFAKAALEATGATPTVMANNTEIKVAKEVSANASEVTKVAEKQYSKFVNAVDTSITLKQVGELSEARKGVLKTGTKRRAVERKIDLSYRKAAIQGFNEKDLSAVLKEGGYKSGSAYNDFQIELGNGGKEAYDAWYKEAPGSMKQWLREQRNINLGAKLDETNGSSKVTFKQFSELQKDANFGKEFDRQVIYADKKMMGSKKVAAASKKVDENSQFLEDLTEAKTASKEANEAYKENIQSVKDSMRKALDDFVDNVSKDGKVVASTNAIRDYGQGDPETVAKYLALREMSKKSNMDKIKDSIKKKALKDLPGKTPKKEVEAYEKALNEAVDSLVREEFNDARLALDSVNSKIIDKKEWAKEIKDLHKKISDSETLPNVIKTTDGNGGIQLVEVSPNLAFLYNYRPRRVVRDGAFDRLFRGTSKLYRFGQTTFSSKSFIMQAFRDSGNAYFMGNAWRDISTAADDLVDVFGKNIVDEIKSFDPSYYEKLTQQVKESGKAVTTENLAKAEVENVQAFGKEISPASTETSQYTNMGRDEAFEKMRSGARDFADKLDTIFNGKREEYLRQRVFMNAIDDALAEGHTYKEAKDIAVYMMNNATTNFSRSLYHLEALSENVPYIRAAINGTTSFWRMFSLDPVGVTGRIAGGLFMPYTYLLGQSLSDPENAKIYANIPEYEKRDSLVFVVRGQKISIPIPQELAPILAPFRHFVEYLWGAQKNNFWDLLGNDILGLSPVDLTGFSNVDMNLMTSDPTIGDRLGRGTARIFSSLAPVPIKAAYIALTQTDPYTGKRIADTSWTYQDPETGEEINMGYNQGKFAEGLAKLLKVDNAALVSKVVSSVFGTTGEDVLDVLAGLVQLAIPGEEGQDPLASIGSNFVVPQFNNAVGALYDEEYDRTNQLWRQAIRELEIEKDAITESKEWKDLQSAMSQAKNSEALAKLRARRQDMLDEFNTKVADTAKRLQSVYGGVLDRTKLSSITQLLNFSTNADFDLSNEYLRGLASDVYYAGSNQAVSTMYKLGIRGTQDYSIFGYYKRNSDGSVSIKYTKPTAILDMANTVYSAKDIEKANLEETLSNAGITRSKMFSDEYYAAKTKAAKKQYKAEWNKKVVEALTPYIESVGVDEVLNNSEIIDYLDNFIFVDNPYNAKKYIQKIFKGE